MVINLKPYPYNLLTKLFFLSIIKFFLFMMLNTNLINNLILLFKQIFLYLHLILFYLSIF